MRTSLKMKVDIDGLKVLFPYDYIYPEQYKYMHELKRCLRAGGSCILEMPSGTGKTISLLALLVAYLQEYPLEYSKIVYCSRTVSEIDSVMNELKHLYSYYQKHAKTKVQLLSLCLSSRKNLCINKDVVDSSVDAFLDGRVVDSKCYQLTKRKCNPCDTNSTAERTRNCENEKTNDLETNENSKCAFFENFDIENEDFVLPYGVYSLEDLKSLGKTKKYCPYYVARHAISTCQILVYSYYYLLDPKIAQIVSRELPSNCVIVFDEAHNIDNVCIETFSIKLTQKHLNESRDSLLYLEELINEIRLKDQTKLLEEYHKMLENIKIRVENNKNDLYLTNPIIPEDILEELIPGSIRKANHFVSFMKRFVEFLCYRMSLKNVTTEYPYHFLKDLYDKVYIDHRPMRLCSERLHSLLVTLELDGSSQLCSSLGIVADFATIVGTYQQGFSIITEPFDQSTPSIMNPKILLCCLDATLAIKPIFDRFKSVVITSGTLSPLDMYPKLLNFNPVVVSSLSMSLIRPSLCPVVVSRGADQGVISSRFSDRQNISVTRNYGLLVANICSVVPDGVVCFFTSYRHLESCMAIWDDMGILAKIQAHKLLFVETTNVAETTVALEAYKKACRIGRGGCFISVARGKVSEGIDFHGFYGRAVIVLGVPYVFTQSYALKARLEYLKEKYGINESDFLTFDAMRHTAQCLGRVIRGKSDYGLMILADQRFARADRIKRLPSWIREHLSPQNIGLSVDESVNVARRFFHHMGQPIDNTKQVGHSLLTADIISSEKFQKSFRLSLSNSNQLLG